MTRRKVWALARETVVIAFYADDGPLDTVDSMRQVAG